MLVRLVGNGGFFPHSESQVPNHFGVRAMKHQPKTKPHIPHKQEMAERRARQSAQTSTTLVMTRDRFRQFMAGQRAAYPDRAVVPRPARNIIITSRYMPHQGKRECERRRAVEVVQPVVQYAEAA
jgi:hypothetical protein